MGRVAGHGAMLSPRCERLNAVHAKWDAHTKWYDVSLTGRVWKVVTASLASWNYCGAASSQYSWCIQGLHAWCFCQNQDELHLTHVYEEYCKLFAVCQFAMSCFDQLLIMMSCELRQLRAQTRNSNPHAVLWESLARPREQLRLHWTCLIVDLAANLMSMRLFVFAMRYRKKCGGL